MRESVLLLECGSITVSHGGQEVFAKSGPELVQGRLKKITNFCLDTWQRVN